MKFSRIYLFPLFVGCLLASCSKNETLPPEDLGLAYYPLKLGAVNVYDVDSVYYDNFFKPSKVTTYKFQLKDSVTDTFIDSEKIVNYRVERYRKTDGQDWTFQRVSIKRIVNNRAEELVDNKRYVRLVFPVKEFRTWNGNLYNGDEPANYEITASNKSLLIGNLQLDSTATVNEINEVNLLTEDVVNETYAKGIGLATKEVRSIGKNIETGEILKGSIYKIQLNSFK